MNEVDPKNPMQNVVDKILGLIFLKGPCARAAQMSTLWPLEWWKVSNFTTLDTLHAQLIAA